MTEYAPKFCRTKGCSERFGHDGRCMSKSYRDPISIKVVEPSHRVAKRARQRGILTRGEFSHYKGPRTSPRVAQVPGAHEHMDRIRAHRH
jgi:hypothetical protein